MNMLNQGQNEELIKKLQNTDNSEARAEILQGLSNEEQFELDKVLCFGNRGVDGTVCFPYRNGKYFNEKPSEKAPWIPNRYISLENLNIELVPDRDNYRTLNILNLGQTSRCQQNVRFLNEMFIDIDLHNQSNMPPSEQNRLLKMLFLNLLNWFKSGEIARPTSFIFSGRGYALHYVLKNPIPVDSEDAITFAAMYQCAFDKMERLLEIHAKETGADIDRVVYGIERLSRVAGTWNTKGGCYSRFIDVSGHYFTLDELITAFIDDFEGFELRQKLKKAGKAITKAAMTKYYAKLDLKALKDQKRSKAVLEKVKQANQTIKQYKAYTESFSDQQMPQWCHVALYGMIHLDEFLEYRKWVDGTGRYQFGLIYYNLARTILDPEMAEYLLRTKLDRMEEPLDEEAVERIIAGTENMIEEQGFPLRYSFDSICDALNIDPEIAEKCGLVSVAARAEKVERNINAATERDKEIMQMHGEGIPRKRIVETLSSEHPEWKVSTRTVSRTIAKYKDSGISDGRTTYRTYGASTTNYTCSSISYLNCVYNLENSYNLECQHSSNVVINNSINDALVKRETKRETVITELLSQNSISLNLDNEFKEYILGLLKNRNNIFLHGMGGTGKTFLIKQFLSFCKQEHRNVAVVAPTAVAASNYENAATIHSFFHFNTGIIDESCVREKQIQALETTDVLIIDEMSMVRCDLFDTILYTIEEAEHRYNKKIQLILCGDVGQLPCVATDDDKTWLAHSYSSYSYMFFDSHRYESLHLTHILLEKNRRTNQDEVLYAQILRHIHDGDSRVLSLLDDRVISAQLSVPDNVITLAAHRNTVNKINKTEIKKHESDPSFRFVKATGTSNTSEADYLVPFHLPVFDGMKIMFVLNKPKRGYVN